MALVPAVALVPARIFGTGVTLAVAVSSALLVLFAGIVHLVASLREPWIQEPYPAEAFPGTGSPFARRAFLPAVLLLVLARGYVGPAIHDCPFMRGVDHYFHVVLANLMLTEGRIEPYLIYPPTFHTLVASVSRPSGLRPLEVFPVLAPALLLLPALACYTLARRLWGWPYGLAAALFSGVLGARAALLARAVGLPLRPVRLGHLRPAAGGRGTRGRIGGEHHG